MHNNNNNNNNHYRRPSECTSPPPPSGSPSPSPSPSPTPTSTHPPLPPHRPRSSAQVPPETPQPRTQNTQSTHNPGPAHPRKPHPWFRLTIHYFATHLAPLVSCSTGQPHPDFPATMLSYHLLTSSQLDDLARHFHQVWPPSRETWEYPVAVLPWLGTPEESTVDIATKRRRFGRFIGLRGCGSPAPEGDADCGAGGESESEEEEGLTTRGRLEQAWEECFRRVREEDDRHAGRKLGWDSDSFS